MPLSVDNYLYMFKNPNYYGIIRFKGQIYEGKHEPIITKKLFDRVQEVLKRKSKPKSPKLKPYLYRDLFKCGECGCFITTETQKGHNYLRCTKRKDTCSQKYVREEVINRPLRQDLKKVSLPSAWADLMIAELEKERLQNAQADGSFAQKLKEQLREYEAKLDQLLDMSLNKVISQEEYAVKRQKILNQKIEASEKLSAFERKSRDRFEPAINFIKEANSVERLALLGNQQEIRDFVKKIGSNFRLAQRALSFDLNNPWNILDKYAFSPHRGDFSPPVFGNSPDPAQRPPRQRTLAGSLG